MGPRIQFNNFISEQIGMLARIGHSVEGALDPSLFSLIHNRASQLNGCAFCLDMDVKKAKMRGESERKMYHIAVWRDSELFSERERAALEFAEALTQIPNGGISDEKFSRMKEHFTEKEIAYITLAIGLVNTFNRINVAFRTPPGSADALLGLDKSGLK